MMNILFQCVHLDSEVKDDARHRKLSNMTGSLDTPTVVPSWYRVSGVRTKKRFVPWGGAGIYSIEEADIQT